jgi:Na+/melibiose symporter-like transporter
MTYYVEAFRMRFEVTATSFVWSQVIFGLWNALNDPLFGWLSDSIAWEGTTVVTRRGVAIAAGGVVWSGTFLVVWWPWGPGSSVLEAAHMAVSLCAYDAALTWVEVNHGAALAELTLDQGDRARANAWSGVCAALGACASWAAHLVWRDPAGLQAFRLVCFGAAAVAAIAFVLSGYGIHLGQPKLPLQTRSQTVKSTSGHAHPANHVGTASRALQDQPNRRTSAMDAQTAGETTSAAPAAKLAPVSKRVGAPGAWQPVVFAQQVLSSGNFRTFALVAGLQAFDCAFEKNFFGTFLDQLAGPTAPDAVSREGRAGVVTASFLLPHLVTVILTPIIRTAGLHAVVARIFAVRFVFLGAAALALVWYTGTGREWAAPGWLAASFLLSNRVASECVCRLFPVVIGDLTDEYSALNPDQSRSRAASVVGASLLLGRLASSIAPVLGFATLQRLERDPRGAARGVWLLLVLVPWACVTLQNGMWQCFGLKGRYLKAIKHAVAEKEAGRQYPQLGADPNTTVQPV